MGIYLNSIIRLIYKNGNDDYSLVSYTKTYSSSDIDSVTRTSSSDNFMSYEGKYKRNEIDGDTILMGDIKLYVDPSTLSTVPKTDDKVSDGTTTYTIKNITRYKEQDTVCLYIFQLRR